jgi:hypothetical protein
MVKYEKLNPNISSPTTIPFYGELITARWGYEALAVKQFMSNRYQKDLYNLDKEMSKANFIRNVWTNTLKGKVDDIENAIIRSKVDESTVADLEIVRNELTIYGEKTGATFDYLSSLYPEKLTAEVLSAARDHLELIRLYNVRLYNTANEQKDAMIESRMREDREGYLRLKKQHFNNSLEEFVRNSNEKERYVEFRGRIVQKTDPIFLDPEHPFLKAHFYAPRKQVFGNYFDTYWVNLAVLWVITALLYLALYFRLLKRGLDSFEIVSSRLSRKNE